MTQRQCRHAALTPNVRPTLDAATDELRVRITLYVVDEPIGDLDLALSGPEVDGLLDVVCPAVAK
ncbi:hypothetical protein [Embleya sp. AB8]|uniref:hypothetical protein n=1 Tax=Embleya sp. AB8 TaxID=3156304 RepID=UPI003C789213